MILMTRNGSSEKKYRLTTTCSLREKHEQGESCIDRSFDGVINAKTPIIVERIVADIDGIVKIGRFEGWQTTTAGKKEVKKALRSVVWIKYKIKDKEVFVNAYKYVEQYF